MTNKISLRKPPTVYSMVLIGVDWRACNYSIGLFEACRLKRGQGSFLAKDPRNRFQEINSASLFSLEDPNPTWPP